MLERFANIWRIPDLRRKVIVTLLLLAVCRLGVFVPIPGVNPEAIAQMRDIGQRQGGGILNVVNLFSGGALSRCAIFGLGVMPYISASIIFQLLASVVPALEKLRKEGEAGRKKLNQYTRYATVVLCFFQAIVIINGMRSGAMGVSSSLFLGTFNLFDVLVGALLMTCGTMLLMWIGEQVDEYGIGNGMSMIIMVNIIARLPAAVVSVMPYIVLKMNAPEGKIGIPKVVLMVAIFVGIVVGIIFVTRGQRRIPFQQAKHTRGRRVYGGMKHYLPLGVNSSGVLPIIFAQSLLMFPAMFFSPLSESAGEGFWKEFFSLANSWFQIGSFPYTIMYIVLIFFFCYFWTAIQFNPTEMADNLKEHGSFIPGIRPGRRTGDYLERIMNRITLPGAAFLATIAIVPSLVARMLGVTGLIAGFYGGTTLLIIVGVALDLVRRIESELMLRHYDGLTRAGRRRR